MTRAVCIVSRNYSLDTTTCTVASRAKLMARSFVTLGLSAHVICSSPPGAHESELLDGVVVHRIPMTSHVPEHHGDLDQLLWCIEAASYYDALDALVDFDLVLCSDRQGESLRIVTGPHTALIIEVEGIDALQQDDVLDARLYPVEALSTEMEIVAMKRADALVATSSVVAEHTSRLVGRPVIALVAKGDVSSDNDLATSATGDLLAVRYLDVLTDLDATPRLASSLRAPSRSKPKLGVIVVAQDALPRTTRCIASILHHTAVPLRLIVVNNASTDGTREFLDDCNDARMQPVHLETPSTLAGARNHGIDQLEDDIDYVIFLDNATEVLACWWTPFIDALTHDGEVGLVVLSRVDDQSNDGIGDACLVMTPETLFDVGRFDERFSLLSHHDFARRATRIGSPTRRIATQHVLHFGSPSDDEARINHDLHMLATKAARQAVTATTPFLVLVDANEAIENPELLQIYASAFTAADECALVLFGVGIEPLNFELALRATAASCGLDLETGPKIIAICPPSATNDDLATIGDEVHAVISAERPRGPFASIAWIRASEPHHLRRLAANVWRARNSCQATPDRTRDRADNDNDNDRADNDRADSTDNGVLV